MATQDERKADPIRQGVGMRLRAARDAKGLSQAAVAEHLETKPGTVSTWETGMADPGIYRLRSLAKLYDVSADALLWENALSNEAMQFAAQYDALTDRQKSRFSVVWLAFMAQAATDEEVEEKMPITKGTSVDKR